LNQLLQQVSAAQESIPKEECHVVIETLCKSLGGIDIPMLTITSNKAPKEEIFDKIIKAETVDWEQEIVKKFREKLKLAQKKILIITGRIHPGEACGSHVIEGLIKFITSSNPIATELRERLIIKIIPMMNVDGVIVGNYRYDLSGQDLNRNFANPNEKLHPIIYSVKQMINNLKAQNKEILAYIDIHGHSKKKCSFIYGPYYPLHMDRYVRVRILSRLLANITPMFRYSACRFKQQLAKMNTARLVISKEFDVVNSLTLENSFYGFINEERKTIEYCKEYYESMGECMCYGVLDYVYLSDEECVLKAKKLFENKRKRKKLKVKAKSKNYSKVEYVKKGRKKVEYDHADIRIESINKNENIQDELNEEKIIRLEDGYQPSRLFVEKKKIYRMKDLVKSIKEEAKIEAESDSSSSSSDNETLIKEKEANLIKAILSMKNESVQDANIACVEKIVKPLTYKEITPRRIHTAVHPVRIKKIIRVNKLKEVKFPLLPPEPMINSIRNQRRPYKVVDSKYFLINML